MKRTLLLTAAVAAVSTVTVNAHGPDAVSPRAQAQAQSLRKVPATTANQIDRTMKSGSPRSIAQAESLRRVPGEATPATSIGYQAIGDDGITASPKARQQLKERSPQVMVAPLK